jgi:chromosome segregation ATPase
MPGDIPRSLDENNPSDGETPPAEAPTESEALADVKPEAESETPKDGQQEESEDAEKEEEEPVDVQALLERFNELKNTLQGALNKIEHDAASRERLLAKWGDSRESLKKVREELAEIARKYKKSIGEKGSLTKKVNTLERIREGQDAQISAQLEQIEDLQTQVGGLLNTIEKMQEQAEQDRRDREVLEGRLSAAETDAEKKDMRISDLEAQAAAGQEQFRAIVGMLDGLKTVLNKPAVKQGYTAARQGVRGKMEELRAKRKAKAGK